MNHAAARPPALSRRARVLRAVAGVAFGALLVAALVAWLNLRGEAPVARDPAPVDAAPAQIERGRYLALAGNCVACHTARGGAQYAGGRGIETPFGTVYGSNLTPDAVTGLGAWNADHFWRALHHGRSRDGRLLYPAFPYTQFTLITRADSDALFAYLRSLPPVAQPNRPHELRFPFNTQAALAVWRALYFRPAGFVPDGAQSAEFNRGAYLVRGLAHCGACHGERNLLGALRGDGAAVAFSGAVLPGLGWYAPSLASAREAGVAHWNADDVVALLRTGAGAHGSALGPMAEVVFRSTQHLSDADLRAMTHYLQSLPPGEEKPRRGRAPEPAQLKRGAQIYRDRCADCHGAEGQGARGAYPPLAGNRAVTMQPASNVIRVVISGGFPPATAGNPRPFGMPPLGQDLSDREIADVVSFIRNAWGNEAPAVGQHHVARLR